MILPDTPPEEALAAIAGRGPVVFAGGAVAAYRAVRRQNAGVRCTCLATAGLQLHVTVWNKEMGGFENVLYH